MVRRSLLLDSRTFGFVVMNFVFVLDLGSVF
jgi:hypothetical protein